MKIKEKKRKMKEAKQSGEKVIHNKLMFNDTILGLGQYGQQPIWYVFNTDIADIIRTRYDTHVCVFRFKNQEVWILTTLQWMFWFDLYSESNKY